MFRRKHSFLLAAALAVILAACGTAASVLSVKVEAVRTTLEVGETLSLSVDVEVAGEASKAVSWSSSDEDVASVGETGLVTANAAGRVTITATSVVDESKQGSVELEVVEGDAVISLTVTAEQTVVEVGETLSLSVDVEVAGEASKAVSWSSSDEDVATVNDLGVVTAVAAGNVEITATSEFDESKQGSVELEVIEGAAVISVEVTAETPRLQVGEETTLSVVVTVAGDASREVRWASSDEDVATVNELGLVTAVGAGNVEITATSEFHETVSGSVSLEVFAAPASDPAAPGETSAVVDGAAVTVSPKVDEGSLSLAVGSSSVSIGVLGTDGDALPIKPGGVPRVTADGLLTVSGSGYAPGSFVDVWFFSEPSLLGTAEADATGDFSGTYALPDGVPTGAHTLIIQGTQSSGEALTFTVGLEVESRTAVVEFAHCPVSTDWFVSAGTGVDTAVGTAVGAPFASIQAAVDAAADHDVVCVAAGRYELDRRGATEGEGSVLVSIVSPLSLIGPNVGVMGHGERGDEAELVVSGADGDTLYAVRVHANDVLVDGFYITTDTPVIDPFPNGIYGIKVEPEVTANVSFRNSVIVDVNYPIYFTRHQPGMPAENLSATGNFIAGPNSQSDQAIYFQAAFGEITDNVIRDARIGIQTQPYMYVGNGLVANNDMEVFQVGLWFNYQETAGSKWVFSNNRVRGIESPWPWPLYTTDANAWSGIRVETFEEGFVTFEGNSVTVGEANPPSDGAVYLLRQRGGSNGEIDGIGTEEQLGEFFTANDFVDLAPAGVTLDDLTLDGGFLQLRLR